MTNPIFSIIKDCQTGVSHYIRYSYDEEDRLISMEMDQEDWETEKEFYELFVGFGF